MELVVVDAFSSEPFRGNPAGVCFLTEPRSDAWMLAVAAELKHAETAFLEVRPDGSYGLRWWSPETEIPLCGHATLASAHALFETGRLASDQLAVFHTMSGILRAAKRRDRRVALDFPVAAPEPLADAPALFAALGTGPGPLARTEFFTLVELSDADAVLAVEPDLGALREIETDAVLVTAAGDGDDVDVVCRVFGPRVGIPEDPVTGSAMCVLAPYWQDRYGTRLRVAQLSRRGGDLLVERSGERVMIAGHAVTILRGDLVA
jgi:PhzF family phenazine biosynthesis protein